MENAIVQGMLAIQHTNSVEVFDAHGYAANQIGKAGSLVLTYSGDNSGVGPPNDNGGVYACVCAHLPPPAPPQPPMMPGCSNEAVARTAANLETVGALRACLFQIPNAAECQDYVSASAGRSWEGAASYSTTFGAGPGCFSRLNNGIYQIRYNTDMHPDVAVLTDTLSRTVCYRGRACNDYSAGSCEVVVLSSQYNTLSHWNLDYGLSEWQNTDTGSNNERTNQPVLIVGTDQTQKMYGPNNHLQYHDVSEHVNDRIKWENLFVDFSDPANQADAERPSGSSDPVSYTHLTLPTNLRV